MRSADLHVHEAVRILELIDPPHPVRAIEKARRRLAKQWHPDHASPDQRSVHERPRAKGHGDIHVYDVKALTGGK